MLTNIYQCTKMTIDFIIIMMISRYIFLIQPLEKKNRFISPQFLFLMISYIIMMIVCLTTHKTLIASMVIWAAIGIYCLLTAKKQKLRFLSIFKTIPIAGIGYGLLMPLTTLPVITFDLQDKAQEVYSLILYIIIAIILIGFGIVGREWRKNFRKEVKYRKLAPWESVMLYVVGTLMYGLVSAIYSYDTIDADNFKLVALLESIVCCITGFVVTLTVITLIMVGNKKAHAQRDLLKMQHNIIITMADIVENRDESTGGHVKRTAYYVKIIAEDLLKKGWYQSILNEKYIEDMFIAAPLHDIGKIHIPDSILKKQGRLTDEEYEIMKSHTTEGRKLLLNAEKTLGHSSYLDIAVEMAYSHHEWWNGKGYPQGISEHNIPLCARIMAVADVFDAIVSQRCYKGSMSIDEAYEIIRKESGTHFDQVVVHSFLDSRDEISEVLKEFEEPLILEKNPPGK